ncbi:HNH endonuclease [Gordonia amicalis]|uniref:HNH endonuclease n=1 Tax=Gordonia amicalis TaxID=89053 RepID=UPI0029543546|nr:HNH endonuclease [Gordonia amicalis]MDV7176013.1 HNH endonuclease [Gordonia amicalis]
MTPGLQSYRNRCRTYGLPAVVEPFTREQLVATYGDACYRCGGAFEEIDHVVCVRAGGPHTIENARPCCADCNHAKYWSIDRPTIIESDFRTVRTAGSCQ